jgi:hypothetical protein
MDSLELSVGWVIIYKLCKFKVPEQFIRVNF